MKQSNLSSSRTSWLAIIFNKNISLLSFLLAFSQKIVLLGKARQVTGDQIWNKVERGTNEFYIFCCFFFPLNLESSKILVLILLSLCTVLLSGLNWKKKKRISDVRKNANVCVKLNLYFFYKNIVYRYLFAYIDIAWLYDIK